MIVDIMNKDSVVAFYTTKEFPYGCFSNFFRSPIELDGKEWPTSEHYYQAQKATSFGDRESIRNASTPKEAARLGRTLKEIRSDWDQVKYNIMKIAVRAKFTQHEKLRNVLLSTGDKILVEWTEGTELHDSIWGNARDKEGNPGKNLLGKALMEIRTELREKEAKEIRLDA